MPIEYFSPRHTNQRKAITSARIGSNFLLWLISIFFLNYPYNQGKKKLYTHTQMCTNYQMQVQTTSIPSLDCKGSSISSYGPQYLLLDRSLLLSLELCPLLWWLRLRLRLLERDLWRWRFSRDLDRVLLFRSRDMDRDRCLRCSLDLDLEKIIFSLVGTKFLNY